MPPSQHYLCGYARVCLLTEIKTSHGTVIKYGDLLHFSDGVPAKKSRTWAKDSPSATVKGDFMFAGFEVPVSPTGTAGPADGGLLLHSVAKLGNSGRVHWCQFLKANYNSKHIRCEPQEAPTYNVPIRGVLGDCSIHHFPIKGGEHRAELLGSVFSSACEMQLARSPMQESARILTFPISTATYFGTRHNDDVAMTLVHSMISSASRRVVEDYRYVGALRKPALDSALNKYVDMCNAAVASVANLKLVSTKLLKALASRFQLEFTPILNSAAVERSQAAAGVGGSMADSHVPSLAATRGRASSATPAQPVQPRNDESPRPTLRKSGLQLPGSAERAQAEQHGPAAKRVRALDLAGDGGDHVLRAGDPGPTVTALGGAAHASPTGRPSTAKLEIQIRNERMSGELKAAEATIARLTLSQAAAIDAKAHAKAHGAALQKEVDALRGELQASVGWAAYYQAQSETKDHCIQLARVTLTLTLTLTLSLTLTRIVAARSPAQQHY